MSGGSFPMTEKPGSVLLRSFTPTLVSTTHSQVRQARSRGSHRFYLTYRYGAMTRARWSEIVSFLDEQDGQFGKFMSVIPGKTSPLGAVSGSPVVNGIHAAGSRSISVKSLPLSTTNVFFNDDLITFASHLKVYAVTRATNSNGSGVATLYLNCPLMSALADNEAITYQNVNMQLARVDDTIDRDYKGGLVMPAFDVNMIEDPQP